MDEKYRCHIDCGQPGSQDCDAIGKRMDAGRRFILADDIITGFMANPVRTGQQRVGKIDRHRSKVTTVTQPMGSGGDGGGIG